jgi:hypothetical protein
MPAHKTLQQKRDRLLDAVEALVHDAERCSYKFGHEEDGMPSDWTEWVNLRRSLQEARNALKREGRTV